MFLHFADEKGFKERIKAENHPQAWEKHTHKSRVNFLALSPRPTAGTPWKLCSYTIKAFPITLWWDYNHWLNYAQMKRYFFVNEALLLNSVELGGDWGRLVGVYST